MAFCLSDSMSIFEDSLWSRFLKILLKTFYVFFCNIWIILKIILGFFGDACSFIRRKCGTGKTVRECGRPYLYLDTLIHLLLLLLLSLCVCLFVPFWFHPFIPFDQCSIHRSWLIRALLSQRSSCCILSWIIINRWQLFIEQKCRLLGKPVKRIPRNHTVLWVTTHTYATLWILSK